MAFTKSTMTSMVGLEDTSLLFTKEGPIGSSGETDTTTLPLVSYNHNLIQ
jgi:hypothetical protein